MIDRMWLLVPVAIAVIALPSPGRCQKQVEPPVAKQAQPVKPAEKPLPPEAKAAIRDAQWEVAKAQAQLDQLKVWADQIIAREAEAQKQVDALRVKALKDAKLDPEKWDVDVDRAVFIEKAPAKP